VTNPAADRKALKKRIDQYLWHDEAMPVAKLRHLLTTHFAHFDEVAVVGGMARDFARRGVRGFRSDVDLVINAHPDAVDRLAYRLGAKRNRFGGYAYEHPLWKIDFWALDTTWAARAGHAQVKEIKDVTKCTFFDCDAIVYDIKTRAVFSPVEYYTRIASNVIDINLEPNPSVYGNLLRAIRRLFCWSATPGPQLTAFIENSLDHAAWNAITSTEASLYANQILRQFRSPRDLRDHIFNHDLRRQVDTNFGQQLELPYVDDPTRSLKASCAKTATVLWSGAHYPRIGSVEAIQSLPHSPNDNEGRSPDRL
jgi:hypothetical protein